MKIYHLPLFVLAIVACDGNESENKKPIITAEPSVDTLIEEEIVEEKNEEPDFSPIGNGCIPEPSKEFLQAKANGTLTEDYGLFIGEFPMDEIYMYLILSEDSLGEKVMVKHDTLFGTYEWTQEFEGITYTYHGYQSGGGGELTTTCSDKSQFVKVMDAVIRSVPCENCYNPEMIWRNDSTSYGVGEGEVGCNYDVEKDSYGHYGLKWYCGC